MTISQTLDNTFFILGGIAAAFGIIGGIYVALRNGANNTLTPFGWLIFIGIVLLIIGGAIFMATRVSL